MPSTRAPEAGSGSPTPHAARFVLSGPWLLDAEDPLGIWEVVPAAETEATAYAASDAVAEAQGVRWLIDLPSVARQARSQLSEGLAATRARQAQLDLVEQRLSQLGGPQPSAFAFGPETELMATVAALQRGPAAYAAGERSAVAYGLISDKAQQLLLQFRRLVQYYARIETRVGGRLLALTTVDWSGDYHTTWQDDVPASELALHLDAVRLALASRQALIRLVSVVTSGALSLATKASVPGGQVLLLPAVYKYVRDVFEELGRYAESRGVLLTDFFRLGVA